MKISTLSYYAKFVFMCDDESCFSTADIDLMDHIKNATSGKRAASFEVGDRIFFEPMNERIYKITSVAVKHLFEDTEDMRLGVDLEDCSSMQGNEKEWLLKILIHASVDKKEA